MACEALAAQLQVQHRIDTIEKRIHAAHRANPTSERLDAGFGVTVSSAVAVTMTDPKTFSPVEFRRGTNPIQAANSRPVLSGWARSPRRAIATCDAYSSSAFSAVIKSGRTRPDRYPCVVALLGRRPAKVVAVAWANRMAHSLGDTGQGAEHMAAGPDVIRGSGPRSEPRAGDAQQSPTCPAGIEDPQ